MGTTLLALLAGGTAIGLPVAGAVGGPKDRTVDVAASVTAPSSPTAHRWGRHPRPHPTRPTGTRPTATRTTATRPTTTQPSSTQPTSTQPSSTQPSTTQPSTTRPTATRPTTTRPTTSTPATADPTSAAPSSASTTYPAGSSAPTENWAGTSSSFRLAPRGGSTVAVGQSDSLASDGKVAALTIPANAGASPSNAAEVESTKTYRYGSFSSRVRSADCSSQPRTGAVTGIFTYGNDGRDHDGDGVTDNSELDVEILCARPEELNLTIWTDYRDSDSAQRRVSRVVNLKTGKISSTCYYTSFGDCAQQLSGAESTPSTVAAVPGFDSSKNYYDYRIDWSADRVVFTVTVDGKDITLWDYRGPADRIPQNSSAYLVNLWHTSDWSPAGLTATAAPSAPLTARVDSSTMRAAS